ncbi:NAD(P)-dependent oxidoreductase [Sulfobacillus harzensis]|uniref:Hydroxyacid dehydrogenase n=1 Tax=Sulfobacillus harzensis TaxID=2729629 RepID=A0A7Y0L6Z1_9FIRM|nr:hydroxyacid dehydrogenase [Sulfobacillus harzensis]NMP23064.1 hydroxyacid dehydrogenase [Sulfobacillus harzensis]
MVVISEWMDAQGLELLKQLPRPVSYQPDLWGDADALKRVLASASSLVVRNRTQVNAALLDSAPELKVVGRLGVGLDNIDVDACQERHVTVVYARGANAIAVVEYVIGALLYSMRPWQAWHDAARDGRWQRHLGGREIHGKTLGLVGMGDIGSRVARTARFLGMTVAAYDPHLAPFHALIADGTVSPESSLLDLVSRCDALTLHAPLRPETTHLIDREILRNAKPGLVLINTARGALIDESALNEALHEGRLGSVFLDVREAEPPAMPDPLASFPNVHLTPHLAGLTQEALGRTTSLVLEDVERVLSGRPPRSPVRWP